MRVAFTQEFQENYRSLPAGLRKKMDKAIRFLSVNPRHPSLQVKRIQGSSEHYYEGRVDQSYRFVFTWIPNGVLLMAVGPHKIIER